VAFSNVTDVPALGISTATVTSLIANSLTNYVKIGTTATFVGTGTASSTNTGILQVQGGVGISGNLYANTVYSGDGYFRGPSGYGNIQLVSGGAVYLGELNVNGSGLIKGPGGSTHIALLSGTGGSVKFYNTATIAGTTSATSTTTGALTVAGGVGIGGDVNIGGNVSMPNRPAFRVYGAGTTNNLGTTVNTNGILNSNNWAVDYQQGTALNTSTGVFTAPLAGLYSIHLVARVTSNTTSSAQVCVIKNVTSTNVVQVMWETGTNPSVNHFGVSTIAKLAVGDTLVTKVLLGQINFDGNDSWAVAYIG
jgi:hypothetical protein